MLRPLQTLVAAHDAHVVPHEAAQFGPVVRQHHLLVRVRDAALVPCRRGRRRASRRVPRADVLGHGAREDQALQERIAGQPVGAVQPRAGGFADCVQARQVGSAGQIDDDAAAGVVRRRHHRNRLPAHVDAEFQAARQNGRKAGAEERRGQMAHVQVDAVRAQALHFMVDGARHDVAGSQLAAFVEALHEAAAVRQQQASAFAAHGFGNQERPRLRVVEAGRMELVELHVGDAAAGAPGHGDAVAGGAVRVGGVEVDLAGAAGGQHHELRLDDLHAVRLAVVGVGAAHAVRRGAEPLRGDQIHRHAPAQHGDVGMRRGARDQRLGDGRSGGVRDMQHAAMRVSALAGEVRRVAVAVERETQRRHMVDALGRARDRIAHDLFVAQSGAGVDGVGDVGIEAVVWMRHRGHAALGAIGGAAVQGILGEHRHAQVVGQVQRRRQACGAAADHQHVCSMSIRHGSADPATVKRVYARPR